MKHIPVLQHYEWQRGVLDIEDTPPESPSKGDAYIIGKGTGVWTGKDNQIARYNDGWYYTLPFDGMFGRVAADQKLYVYNTNTWEEAGKYYLKADGTVALSTNWNIDGADTLFIDKTNGRVGIGTDSPQYKLHGQKPNDPWPYGGIFFTPAKSDDIGFNTIGGNGGYGFNFYGTAYLKPYATAEIRLSRSSYISMLVGSGDEAPTQMVYIDSTGLGISTSQPRTKLSVADPSGATLTLERDDQIVTAGDVLGNLDFYSKDISTSLKGTVGRIRVIAITDFSSGSTPPGANAAMTFHSNTGNAGTLAEAMRIMHDGRIGVGTTTPETSALLDLTSTIGALLVPRMTTTQRDALTPVNGMIIYNSTTNAFNFYENGSWVTK